MLRRGLTERSPSVCAFCQHRLSWRQARLPTRRLLSSTTSLRDNGSNGPGSQSPPPGTSSRGGAAGGSGGSSGWGKPLFAKAAPATNSAPLTPSNGAAPLAPSSSASTLLPHEIEARQRMAARRAEEERAAADRATAEAPTPGQGFRYTWNARKQTEIKESARREAKPQRASSWNNRTRDLGLPPAEHPEKSTEGKSTEPHNFINRGPMPFSRERRPHRSLPLKSVGGGFSAPPNPLGQRTSSAPKDSAPAVSESLLDNEIRPAQLTRLLDSDGFFDKPKRREAPNRSSFKSASQGAAPFQPPAQRTTPQAGGWNSGLFSNTKAPQPPQESRTDSAPLRSTWDSVKQHERGGSKQDARGSSEQASFNSRGSWNSLNKRPQSENANNEGFWSMMEKNTRQKPKPPPRGPLDDWGKDIDRPQRSQQSESRNMDFRRSQPARGRREDGASDAWNAAGRKTQDHNSPVEEIEIQPAPVVSPVEYQQDERRSRRQESNRSSRFEVEEEPAPKVSKKHGGRSSKRNTADEDEDMNDTYEDYAERRQRKAERKAKREAERTEPRSIILPELISISNLASALKVEKTLFLSQLAELGFESVSLDSIMAGETAALVAQEYGFEPTVESGEELDLKVRPPPEDPTILPPRPPVVTIMGHVDHGKTTLLDYLRKSSVAAGEHGGITQHIGAFSVSMSSGKNITFLDTPGHAAFLTMRQRGANVTDIVVLVVAADDSVKPQTLEALKHARSSNVPIIVAINKIDKEGAHIERVKSDLASNGVEIEDYGGDVQVVCVSGKTGQGMEDLEENILTLSEILDMRAETDGPAEGWILESSLKPIGKAATILVKRGTMRPGDFILAGTTYAKIRHLRNEAGQMIDEAPPGTPVEILGWRDLPAAGDQVIQGSDERRVRQAAEYREGLREREQDAAAHEKIAEQRRQLSEQRRAERAAEEGKRKRIDGSWGTQEVSPETEGGAKLINFVVKGDVHGSVEAVCAAISEIGSNEVQPRVLRSSPGAITESDVEHAATSNSAIVNFNLPISGSIKRQAETAGVKIMDHTVIYHVTDDVKDHLSSFLGVDISYKVLAEAEVLQIFPINIKGRQYKNIAGCRIRNGTVERNQMFRVMRGRENIFEGKLESFKHGKKDIDEARKGGECGIGFEFFQDLEVGDQIQAIEEVQTRRTL